MDDELQPIHMRSGDVELLVQGAFAIALGPDDAIDRVMESVSAKPSDRVDGPRGGAGLLGLLGNAGLAMSAAKSGSRYFEFSPETLERLRQGVAADAGGGFRRGGIQGAAGKFIGNVEWRAVDMGPEQLMSAQLAMATATLQAAIREVQEAVERVEAKVDVIKRRVESQQLGDIVGRHQFLRNQVALWEQLGRITATDWASIAPLGAELMSDLTRIRAYVSRTVSDAQEGGDADDRADAVRDLLDLASDLDLLTLAEQSLFLYESLRLQHLQQHDPDAVHHALRRARSVLESQRSADQELVRELEAAGSGLTRVRALEIHRFFSRRQLERGVDDLNELGLRFAQSRHLEHSAIPDSEQPTMSEAVEAARRLAVEAGGAVKSGARATVGMVRQRLRRPQSEPDGPALDAGSKDPELGPGTDPPQRCSPPPF